MAESTAENVQTNSTPALGRSGSFSGAVTIVLYILLILVSWRCLQYVSGSPPLSDSSVFSGAARHMMEGRTLYADVWDHKPPVVYLINYWAMMRGDGTINSVRYAERLFAITGCLLIFVIGLVVFKKPWVGFVCGLFYLIHMYYPDTFEGGNLTEEYGAVFAIGGIAGAISTGFVRAGLRPYLSALSGLLFSLAILCKEPFILIALPWFIYILWPFDGKAGRSAWNGVMFIAGGIVTVLCVAGWLWNSGALDDWIDTIRYNMMYSSMGSGNNRFSMCFENLNTKMMSALFVTRLLAGVGVFCVFDVKFVKKYRFLPLFFLMSALVGLYCTTLSGRYHGHYYMMLVPGYILLTLGGLIYLCEMARGVQHQRVRRWLAIILPCVLLFFCVADGRGYLDFGRRLMMPSQRWQGDLSTRFVWEHTTPEDRIWAPKYPFNSLYAETARLSPTKWFILTDDCLSSTPGHPNAEKVGTLRTQLENDPPMYVFINSRCLMILEKNGLLEWFTNRFKLIFEEENPNLMTLQIWQPIDSVQ